MSTQGTIFNVQSYCIHDGPGIRSTVFFKGCPLSCLWCQNPESQSPRPQLLFFRDTCQSCGRCAQLCPQGAIAFTPGEKPVTDRARCVSCGRCAVACPAAAREISGQTVSADEVLEQVLADRLFLESSGGGMTLSGGEPLMQPDFAAELLSKAQEQGLHTAVESCLFAPRAVIDRVYAHVNLALCDLKHMDSAAHRRLTGAGNETILANLVHLRREMGKDMEVRTPIVPGCNDDLENIRATARFIAEELGADVPWRLLPYHRLGLSKAESLELPDAPFSADMPTDQHLAQCKAAAEEFGITVLVGH